MTTPQADRHRVARPAESVKDHRPVSAEQAIRQAHAILTAAGVQLSPSKITRLCRDYVRKQPPVTFPVYLANNTGRTLANIPYKAASGHGIEWCDPTADTAVQNVLTAAQAA